MQFQDWFILAFASLMEVTATVYLFMHNSAENFASWCAFGATIGGIYHWLTIRDAKVPDAEDYNGRITDRITP